MSAGAELSGKVLPGTPLLTLFSGWALRSHTLADGSRQVLDVLLPGDLIGLPQALLGTSTCVVTALTPVTVCVLEPDRLAMLIEQCPSLGLSLLAARVREEQRADAHLILLGRMRASQRAAYFLLELRERLVRRGLASGVVCSMPMSRGQLADTVGLSRVHLIRALRVLREQGLLDLSKGSMSIPSVPQLAEFCGYSCSTEAQLLPIL